MKKNIFFFFGLFLAANLFPGCAKKDNNNAAPILPVKSWAMGATIGAVVWQTDSITGDTSTDPSSGITSIVVGGATKGDSSIAIGVLYGIDPGNYDLSKGSGYNFVFVIRGIEYTSISGTLYIGLNSNNILAGTFEGVVSEINGPQIGSHLSVTNGHFRITY